MTSIRNFLTRHYKITVLMFVLPSILILAQNIGYQELGTVKEPGLNEISGMVAGGTNTGIFWVHNDSGDKSCVYAIDRSGDYIGRFNLAGARNRDWEDIAAGPGPDGKLNYLYLADIGDNEAIYPVKIIYRLPEPHIAAQAIPIDTALTDYTTITFTYPDGPRDAECLLADPRNGDIYVLSKRDIMTHVYYAPFPQPVDSVFEIRKLGTIPVTGLTGGDISRDGNHVLLKNYTEVYHWYRPEHETLFETLSRDPERLPYIPEPQGESIAWEPAGDGYVTISEVVGGIPARLVQYAFGPYAK